MKIIGAKPILTASIVAILGVVAQATVVNADTTSAKEGEAAFNTFCVACHQAKGEGKPGVAPSLVSPEFLASAPDSLLLETIENGRPGTAMVGWKAVLGEKKIRSVIAYLRSFAKSESRVAQVNAEPAAKGDPAMGKEFFNRICAGCHGENGGGYLVGGNAPAIGNAGFQKVASDGYIREMVRKGRSNTRMRGFQGSDGLANLTNQEIDNVISYLRTLNSAVK
ncbi:c-type cytochrome [Thiolapillus sp.]